MESGLATYQPGYPPLSPVTDSFFYLSLLLDLKFGDEQKSASYFATEFLAEMEGPAELLTYSKNLHNSRMGIYETVGDNGQMLVVRELVTDRKILVHPPTNFLGETGMLRFVRLAPPLQDEFEYYSELTTPYILVENSAEEWTAYLNRVMPASVLMANGQKSTATEDRLAAVFKEDCGAMPWIEYIFQGYHSYQIDAVYLTGLPDDPASLPHSTETFATNPQSTISRILMQKAKTMGITIIPKEQSTALKAGNDSRGIEVALTRPQREAAAKMLPNFKKEFRTHISSKQKIKLPEKTWIQLVDLTSKEIMRHLGRERTPLRNLRKAIEEAIG